MSVSSNHEDDDEDSVSVLDLGDGIDTSTFEQILEMDDDEDNRDFSKSIVTGFFEQAEQTFIKMDDALEAKNLATLSSLGHFLKGSSATLGLTKVRDSCEKIERYSKKNDESVEDLEDEQCLEKIENILKLLKEEYAEVEKVLNKFYGLSS